MDDIVLRGMAKWPNVPAVYGWLTLTRRGHWLIKGEPVGNPAVSAFIARNYEHDDAGRWFFQNGPQRVFVALDYTPFVYRVVSGDGAAFSIEAHTGIKPTSLTGAWIDEEGSLLLQSEYGVGLVHDQGLDTLVQALTGPNGEALTEDALDAVLDRLQAGAEAPLWLKFGAAKCQVGPLRSSDVPKRFGFDPSPAPPEGGPT